MDIVDHLNELGYDLCPTVINYDETFELLEAHKLDLVLCDVQINGTKDGTDLAKD